jgi:hypothetical protein
MAGRLFGKKRKSKDDRETDGLDWADFVRQGASVTLALVKEAADFAPVPGLKQAAGTTLQILAIIQVWIHIFYHYTTTNIHTLVGGQGQQISFPASRG